MKKSTIMWSVLLGTLCAMLVLYVVQFAAIPVAFKPNWLTITPVLVIWAASVGVLLHKHTAIAEPRTRNTEMDAELVIAGEPLA